MSKEKKNQKEPNLMERANNAFSPVSDFFKQSTQQAGEAFKSFSDNLKNISINSLDPSSITNLPPSPVNSKSFKDYYQDLLNFIKNGELEEIRKLQQLSEIIRLDKDNNLGKYALDKNVNPEIVKILLENGLNISREILTSKLNQDLNDNQEECFKLLIKTPVGKQLIGNYKDKFIDQEVTAKNLQIMIDNGMSVNKFWDQIIIKKDLSKNNKECIKLIMADKQKFVSDLNNPPLLDSNMTPEKLKLLVENGVSVSSIWDGMLSHFKPNGELSGPKVIEQNNLDCIKFLAGETINGVTLDSPYKEKIATELKESMSKKKDTFLVDLINRVDSHSLANVAQAIPFLQKLGANVNAEIIVVSNLQKVYQTPLTALAERLNKDEKKDADYIMKNYISCINSLIDCGANSKKTVQREERVNGKITKKELTFSDIIKSEIKKKLTKKRDALGVEIRKERFRKLFDFSSFMTQASDTKKSDIIVPKKKEQKLIDRAFGK